MLGSMIFGTQIAFCHTCEYKPGPPFKGLEGLLRGFTLDAATIKYIVTQGSMILCYVLVCSVGGRFKAPRARRPSIRSAHSYRVKTQVLASCSTPRKSSETEERSMSDRDLVLRSVHSFIDGGDEEDAEKSFTSEHEVIPEEVTSDTNKSGE